MSERKSYFDGPYFVWGDNLQNRDFIEEEAIKLLLEDEVLTPIDYKGNLGLAVIANDVFSWGTAEIEYINYYELENLWKLHEKNKIWGSVKWCCLHRGEQPQRPIKQILKEENLWDSSLENLIPNKYDEYLKTR